MIAVVMGVSGSGKTTVGRALAQQLGWSFYEGDDFHPPENVERMKSGTPLTDEDRAPWLDALRAQIERLRADHRNAVFSCSALKRRYRTRLRVDHSVRFVYLDAPFSLVRDRLSARSDHFMPLKLLESQYDELEVPRNAVRVPVDGSPEEIVRQIRAGLHV